MGSCFTMPRVFFVNALHCNFNLQVYVLFQAVLSPQTLPLITAVSLVSQETTFVAFLPLQRANQVDFFKAAGIHATHSCDLLNLIHIHGFILRYPPAASQLFEIQKR
jgi:hypothetical protein